MKVAHVITRLIVGGAQENTVSSVIGLREKYGMDVQLLSGPTTGPEGSLVQSVRSLGDDFIEVPDLIRSIHPIRDHSAFRFLRDHFLKSKPDIVHTHSGKAGFIGRMAAAAAGVNLVIHSVHGPSFGPFQGWLKNVLYTRAEKVAARKTHHFITVADAMTRAYVEAGIAPREKFTRVFSGFELREFEKAENNDDLRRELGIQNSDFVVGKIGRLFRLKGHDDLFKVAPRITEAIPEIKFLLIGGGEWEDKFKRMAEKSGLSDHFVFTGLVPPQRIPSLVGIMDLLVHLSFREGLPRAIPQAQAAGKPVIAYDCDGAGEVCRDGRTGYLVTPGDIESLHELILRIYENPDLAFKFGSQGRDFVLENFSVDRLVDAQYELYTDLTHRMAQNYVI